VNCRHRRRTVQQGDVATLVTLYLLSQRVCRCKNVFILEGHTILAVFVRNPSVNRILSVTIYVYIGIHTNVTCVTNLLIEKVNTLFTYVYILGNVHTSVMCVKNPLLDRTTLQYICVYIVENVPTPAICVRNPLVDNLKSRSICVYTVENDHILAMCVINPLVSNII